MDSMPYFPNVITADLIETEGEFNRNPFWRTLQYGQWIVHAHKYPEMARWEFVITDNRTCILQFTPQKDGTWRVKPLSMRRRNFN